jgi:hypothetical protein
MLPDPARYTCYRAAHGESVPPSSPFVDIVTGEAAWFDTRVRLLWDDTFLYFRFTAEETNIWSTLTERDSKIYEENDLEFFIAGRDAYYEFEINAANVIYEVFWIWKDIHQPGGRYWNRPEFDVTAHPLLMLDGVGGHVHPRGMRYGFLDWDLPGLQHAVHIDGTLKRTYEPSLSVPDRGWSAEIAVPWSSLALLADGRALPPKEGDVWRIDCSRFQKIGPHAEVLDPCAGWTWNRHGYYDSHIPEAFPYVTFTTKPPT